MAKTMFFNNIEYTAQDFVDLFKGIRSDGIRDDDDLKVTASSPNAMTVDVATGVIFVNGYFTEFKTTTQLNITSNTSGYIRKDVICVKVDVNNQNTSIVVIEGIPSESPVVPSIPVVEGENYVELAVIEVGNNVNSISNANITDRRKITKIWDDFNTELDSNQNGYIKLPNGFILQWGFFKYYGDEAKVMNKIAKYPITFPNVCYQIVGSINTQDATTNPRLVGGYVVQRSRSEFQVRYNTLDLPHASSISSTEVNWIAIGR